MTSEDFLLDERRLEDGRIVSVVPLTFGRARITIGDGYQVFDNW